MFFRARLVLYMRIRECQRQNVFGIGIHGDVYYMRYNVPNGKEHIYFFFTDSSWGALSSYFHV